jgi:peptidoglycan/LPS O-acetylase OafA/YrhL
MYWAAMATVLVMIYLGKYRVEPIGHFLYSMTLLPQEGAPAYDVSWTLEREMVFYLLAGITVPLAGVPGLAVVMALLAAGGWYLGNPWTFHLVATTQADFLAGVIVFLLHHHLARVGAFVPIMIGGGALWLTRSHSFVFDVPICMAMILTGTINLRLPWSRSPFRWIVSAGNASYSIYLLHYIVFYWAAVLSARLPWTLPEWMCEPWRYTAIVVCCFISHGTWKVIEEPANRFAERLVTLRVRGPHSRVELK